MNRMKYSSKYSYFLVIIHVLFLSMDARAQESILLDGKEYVQVDSVWHVKYLGELFRVDESVITVKWKSGIAPFAINTFLNNNGAVVVRSNILGYADVKILPQSNIIEVVRNFINSGLVEHAEPNTFGRWASSTPPNDPYFSTKQWHLNQANGYHIDALEAWEYTTGSPSVVAAVIDNGIDWRHEDLGKGTDSYENIWLNANEDAWSNPNDPTTGNGVDNDGNGYIDDWKGWNFYTGTNNSIGVAFHGTAIAGIIAGKTNNNKGISGVAGGWNNPGVKLVSIVIGGSFGPETALADDAILYAVSKGAKIINMSFKVSQTSAINTALEYAYNSGCILVAAAGNRNDPYVPCNVWYPASHPYVIAVAGVKKNGTPYPSCSTPASDSLVNISAPAGGTLLIDPDDYALFSTKPNNEYGVVPGLGGTSYAAPQVVGATALLLAVNPTLAPQQIRCILERAVDDMGDPGHDPVFGWGRLNVARALQTIIVKLNSPVNGSFGSTTQTLTWNTVYGATSYRVQVATHHSFSNPVFDQSGITSTSITVAGLSNNTTYYWHVRADNALCNVSTWSQTWSFTACVSPPPAPQLTGSAVKVTQPDGTIISYPKLDWTSVGCNITYKLYSGMSELPEDCIVEAVGSGIYSGPATSYTDYLMPLGSNGLYVCYGVVAVAIIDQSSSPLSNTVLYRTRINWKQGEALVSHEAASPPTEIALASNHPNPFNPHTTIKYSLPKPLHVKLVVYDVFGREVRTLVDQFQDAGLKSVYFNANDLSSGIYFYRLMADKFTEVKKMLLMR